MDTVRVIYHREAAGWWAESPDIEGRLAAGDANAELVKLVEAGVPFVLGTTPSTVGSTVSLDQTTALIDYEGRDAGGGRSK